MRKLPVFFLCSCVLPLSCQTNRGALHLKATDPAGHSVKVVVRIPSEANDHQSVLQTDGQGNLVVARLAFGIYRLEIEQTGFAPVYESVAVRSSLPADLRVQFKIPSVQQSVTVSADSTLIDPGHARAVNQIGARTIGARLGSIPGRSLQDLVNFQPAWLYEGNAVLHPRGSEYQTQFVLDGFPLTDNRWPSFGNEIEADDAQSISIYTAGIPAD